MTDDEREMFKYEYVLDLGTGSRCHLTAHEAAIYQAGHNAGHADALRLVRLAVQQARERVEENYDTGRDAMLMVARALDALDGVSTLTTPGAPKPPRSDT